ncbi:MAG: OmpA family protein [Chlorobi bacterium]|nr:OmpA family protein [Chlorobiota bacterium]
MKYLFIALFIAATTLAVGQIVPTVLLKGIVLNGQTRKPIEATLTFTTSSKNSKAIVTNSNVAEGGAYQCILMRGTQYEVTITANGYCRLRDTITIPDVKSYSELTRDFVLLPKEIGQRFIVSIPLFEYNLPSLRTGASEELARYAQFLADNPTVHIAIECYPDRNDSPTAIESLTRRRAEAIKAFFSQRGISSTRIRVERITTIDPYNPPPQKIRPKGRFYFGGTYFVIVAVQ